VHRNRFLNDLVGLGVPEGPWISARDRLLAFARMRPSELAGLRVGSVDFRRGRIRVDTSLVPVHAFGDEGFRLVEGPTKTEAGDRDVPVPQGLCDLLVEMLAGRQVEGAKVESSDSLFTQPKGGPLNVKWFREFVTRRSGPPACQRRSGPTTSDTRTPRS
jgi:integrase